MGNRHRQWTFPRISVPKPAKTCAKVGLDICFGTIHRCTGRSEAHHHNGRLCEQLSQMFAHKGNKYVLRPNCKVAGDSFCSAWKPRRIHVRRWAAIHLHEFPNFLKMHGIAHTHLPVYNLTENGLVEVFNQVLKYWVEYFRFDKVSWEKGIQELLKTYRATHCPGLGHRVQQRSSLATASISTLSWPVDWSLVCSRQRAKP